LSGLLLRRGLERTSLNPRRWLLRAIAKLGHPLLAGAMSAAENAVAPLHAVPNHPAAAMGACGRQRVDGALEAIEDVRRLLGSHFECLVVVVSQTSQTGICVASSFPR